MSLSNQRMGTYAKTVLQDEECMTEVIRRMSVRYFSAFRYPESASPSLPAHEVRERAARKTDMLEDFFSELRGVLGEMADLTFEKDGEMNG